MVEWHLGFAYYGGSKARLASYHTENPMIRIENLCFTYGKSGGGRPVLEDINLSITKGERVAIIGPSGCGKTTLLYILAGLVPPTTGAVWVDGEPVRARRWQTALILQEYGLLPWKTVWQNVALGLEIRRQDRRYVKEKVDDILQELGLGEFGGAYPATLSGGQKQRVAVARALALQPDLLLMDEPFSALDALAREQLQDELLLLGMRRQITLALVTHSIGEAVFLGRKVIILSPQPGRIEAIVETASGELDYRDTKDYHEQCGIVRRHLAKAMDIDGLTT